MKIVQTSGKGRSRVTIDGRDFVGRNVIINSDGQVIVDGVMQSGSLVGPVSIEIHGDAERVESSTGTIKVAGTCGSASTQSGDIECGDVKGSVSTMSGDVTCQSIAGNCKTMSGNIIKG